jgi:hypothetical protein
MKTISTFVVAATLTMASWAMIGHSAQAEQPRYTCRTGALTITSTSPCYVTLQGISVPGTGGVDKKDGKEGGTKDKKGGGFGGPKDLKDKPKGGGFGGPKDVKNKF